MSPSILFELHSNSTGYKFVSVEPRTVRCHVCEQVKECRRERVLYVNGQPCGEPQPICSGCSGDE